jgi:hypothetical protein
MHCGFHCIQTEWLPASSICLSGGHISSNGCTAKSGPPATHSSGGEAEPPELTDVAVPLRLRHDGKELAFFSMTAVVGAPLDVTVAEVAIESFYPADAATAEALQAMRG